MRSLGKRLCAVLEILKENAPYGLFADVGSDHAYLACAVKQGGLSARVIASDVNAKPLEKGKAYAQKLGAEVEFLLSDGFDAFDSEPADAAAVCGMGGELTASIIARSCAAKRCLLVLQPMTAQDDLRRYLYENGFKILCERFVCENKKPYVIISARYAGENTEYSYPDLYLGQVRPAVQEYAEYVKRVLSAAKKRLYGAPCDENIKELIGECQTQITNLSGMNF
ncbi:MAG: SAM-dependent methyltransferase [Clostridia bacterium]|nr:SAM-dependent methyltransferase [Clostridia bacterium]